MERKDKRIEFADAAERYLKSVSWRYVFDESSGLYQERGEQDEDLQPNQRRIEIDGQTIRTETQVERDWLDFWLIKIPGVLLAAATLLLLAVTVFYARKQWEEAKKTADAAISATKISADALTLSRKEFASSQAAVLQPSVSIRSRPTGKAIQLQTNAPVAQIETFIQVDLINSGKIAATHVNGVIATQRFGQITIKDAVVSAQNPSPEYQSGYMTRRFSVATMNGPFFDSKTLGHERITIDLHYFNGIDEIDTSFCYTLLQDGTLSSHEWEECSQQQR